MANNRKRKGRKPPQTRNPRANHLAKNAITTTNGNQFTIHYLDGPKPNHNVYEGVAPTSTTSFITLRTSLPKYRKLFDGHDSLDRTGTVVAPKANTSFITLRYRSHQGAQKGDSAQRDQDQDSAVKPPKPQTSIITLRYQSRQDAQKGDIARRDQDQDSAVDVASPTGQLDTTSQDLNGQIIGQISEFNNRPSSAPFATQQDSTYQAGSGGDIERGVPRNTFFTALELPQVVPGNSAGSFQTLNHSPTSVDTRRSITTNEGDQLLQKVLGEGKSQQQASAQLQPTTSAAPFVHPALVTEKGFQSGCQSHGNIVTSNATPGKVRTCSHSAAFGPSAPQAKQGKIARLKLPLGWHLDDNMQPLHDPNDVSGILKGVVDDLYDVQSKTHGFIPETQNLLIDKISEIADKLARLKDVTDPQVTPNHPIHHVRIAPEIVDYVDEGRNPDIFTREFVENVQRGNAVINGKKQAFKDFSVILAQKMKEGIGGIDRQVDQIMQNAGLEKELAEAEKKAKEDREASGTDAKKWSKMNGSSTTRTVRDPVQEAYCASACQT